MASDNIYSLLRIDEQSITPKYLQLSHQIVKGVEGGKIGKDELLPSINDLSFELDISRDTIERAYKHLKTLGVVGSVAGKGYFIAKTAIKLPLKIFLLFNKLSTHKKIIYDAFVAALGQHAAVDFYIYNNDFALFRKLLNDKKDDYSHYVIIGHFLEGGDNAPEIINSIAKDKLILLDKLIPEVRGDFGAVYENFDLDIYEALRQAKDRLAKYNTIKIIFPEYTYHPREILNGFFRFCQQYAFCGEVVQHIAREEITKNVVYISLMENDLVILIEKILDLKLLVGQDVGVISYNETPLKKIILNGITTISTDFQMMGEQAARLILENSREQIAIPFYLTLRDSL